MKIQHVDELHSRLILKHKMCQKLCFDFVFPQTLDKSTVKRCAQSGYTSVSIYFILFYFLISDEDMPSDNGFSQSYPPQGTGFRWCLRVQNPI